MSSSSSWPPESLAAKTEDIINECELMEVFPERGAGKQFVPVRLPTCYVRLELLKYNGADDLHSTHGKVVELAALLFTGEYVHARHTWRRWKDNNPPPLLLDWWRVGGAMMEADQNSIWQGLSHIQANHPAPLNSYAAEVGTAYRKRILERFSTTQPYLSLLNFSSPTELEHFCTEHKVGPKFQPSGSATISGLNVGTDGKTSLTEVVAFLETSNTRS